jgi:hypothetical protein
MHNIASLLRVILRINLKFTARILIGVNIIIIL